MVYWRDMIKHMWNIYRFLHQRWIDRSLRIIFFYRAAVVEASNAMHLAYTRWDLSISTDGNKVMTLQLLCYLPFISDARTLFVNVRVDFSQAGRPVYEGLRKQDTTAVTSRADMRLCCVHLLPDLWLLLLVTSLYPPLAMISGTLCVWNLKYVRGCEVTVR